jgi:hypothetical protein
MAHWRTTSPKVATNASHVLSSDLPYYAKSAGGAALAETKRKSKRTSLRRRKRPQGRHESKR